MRYRVAVLIGNISPTEHIVHTFNRLEAADAFMVGVCRALYFEGKLGVKGEILDTHLGDSMVYRPGEYTHRIYSSKLLPYIMPAFPCKDDAEVERTEP